MSRVTCEQASSLAVATNLGGVNNVLQLCRRVGAMVVYFSTSEVYGPDCDPMDEEEPAPRPNNRYGLSKLLGERLVEYEVRAHGLRAVTLRPFMVYDEHEALGDHRSAMIRFAASLAAGPPIEVHRGSTRGWLHSSDAVRAIERAARVEKYLVVNIGHEEVVPMRRLAEMLAERLGAPRGLIRSTSQPARMTLVKRPLLARMNDLLGVTPTVSLKAGVDRVCRKIRERDGVV